MLDSGPVAIRPEWVTTAMGFDGYRVVRNCGVVRGIVVRSRSVIGNIGASLQTLVGGNITLYTELCGGPARTRSRSCCSTAARWEATP